MDNRQGFEKNIDELERKFDTYLTMSIIGASKDDFKKLMKVNTNEETIIDDEDYCAVLQGGSAFNNPLCVYDEDIDLKIDIKIALSCLPENEQTAINLLINEQLTQDEVAKRLNVHVNTVQNRRNSAFKKIRKYFNWGGNDEK